jgi:hypothetical protein
MKRYAGMFGVKPGVRLRKRMRLSFTGSELGNPVVYARDIVEEDEFGTDYESGIQFGIEVDAPDMEVAFQRCGRISDAVCSFLSFLTGVGLPVVEPTAILQVGTEPKEGQEYIQFYYPPLAPSSYRQVAVDDVHGLLNALSACRREWREMVLRAIRWYRRCSQYDDIIDRFVVSWIGMETLSPALREALGIEKETRRCPHCNKKLPSGVQLEGLEEFLTKRMPDGMKLFQDSRKLRNKLFHGGGRIKKEIEKASRLVPLLREATTKAVCLLLNLKPRKTILTRVLLPHVRRKMKLEAQLFRIEDEPLERDGEFPIFDVKVVKKKSYSGKNGRLIKENFHATLEGPLAKKVRMSPGFKMTLFGPELILKDVKAYKRTDKESAE